MIVEINCDIFEADADVICHQVNCQGVMGSGIAAQVRARYPEVYDVYRAYCLKALASNTKSLLGEVLFVDTNDNCIANCFSQNMFGYDGRTYTNYDAVKEVFTKIANEYTGTKKFIAIPYKYGCARGGGDWETVYNIICNCFDDYDGVVYICKCDKG